MSDQSPRGPGRDETATQTAATDMLPSGTVLAGRYRIESVIGVGAMGIVYEAHDQQLGVDIAIKLLKPDQHQSERGNERFRREILLARQISHPNVVRIHDLGQDGDVLFLTMDLVRGHTLKERLSEGPMSPEDAAEMGAAVASALAAAHEQAVVHRDLKPANILIDEQGRSYITDFGVARSLNEGGLTVAGQVLGTPDYLSPEQVRGETVDGRSDMYALGLILCEALTGRLPFSGETLDETLAQRSAGRTLDPARLAPDMPRWMLAILRRCLAREPQDRYADASALADDLSRATATRRLHRRVRQGGLVATGLVLLGALAWQLWPLLPDEEATPREVERIAVLPLVTEEGQAHAWSGRALAESLSAGLAERPDLELVDNIRVLQILRNLRLSASDITSVELRQLADLLEVSGLVHGRLEGRGDEVRAEVVLHGADGAQRVRATARYAEESLSAATESLLEQLAATLTTSVAERPLPTLHSASSEAMAAYEEGMDHLLRGDSVQAVSALETAVELDAAFATAWRQLAEAYADTGLRDLAIEAAAEAVELLGSGRGRQALWANARYARLIGDLDSAYESLQSLVEAYPNDIEARVALGELEGDRGEFSRAREMLESVADRDPNHPRVWFLLGKFAILSGDPRRAADDYLVRALVVQHRVGGAQGRGEVLNAMGIAHEHLGELELARDNFQAAVDMREQAGDQRGVAASLGNLARLEMIAARFDQARVALSRALEISESLGDRPGMANFRNEFGLLEEERGDYAAALAHFREALRLRRQLGQAYAVAQSQNNVAFAYLMLGEYENAAVFVDNALESYRAHQDSRGEMTALQTLGQLHTARGEWDAALRVFLEALEIARESAQPFSEAAVEGGLGDVARHQGRLAVALEAYDRAIELLRELDDVRGLAEFSLRRAELLQWLGRDAQAQATLDRAEEWVTRGRNLAQQAHLARLRQDFDQAREYARQTGSAILMLEVAIARAGHAPPQEADALERLLQRAEQSGHRILHLEAASLLARQQWHQGDVEAAEATVARALRPPQQLDPWAGNWRFHLIRVRLAEWREDPVAADAARVRMNREYERLTRGLSPEWQTTFLARAVAWAGDEEGHVLETP